jgi:D-sedoheptulose 7-phosphate isomerase
MAKPKVERKPLSEQPQLENESSSQSETSLALKEIQESIETKQKLGRECIADIEAVAETITAALREGRKVVFFGNGGSAADAQHLAAELVGKFVTTRPPLRAMAFTTNASVLTAVGNDFAFDQVFSRQVAAHIDMGDVVIGISTSGRSKNVLNGIREAKRLGAKTVALTGGSGAELAELCDHRVMVPSTNTQRIQECHILIGHVLCALVDARMSTPGAYHRSPITREPRDKTVEVRHMV